MTSRSTRRVRSLILVILSLLPFAPAHASPDQPAKGETFSTFFRRITTSGQYTGVQLQAPADFQTRFLKWYSLGEWVGIQQKAEREVVKQGADLWFNWYKSEYPLSILFSSEIERAVFAKDFAHAKSDICKVNCRTIAELSSVAWSDWTIPEREVFAITFVMRSKLFSGRRLIDEESASYGVTGDKAVELSTVRILSHDTFIAAVQDFGWKGPVYFRGITGPDPKVAGHFRVILDGDMIRTMTVHTEPILQALEYVGILTHEMSHVLQSIDASANGIDLAVKSVGGMLLIEGQAEYYAEQVLMNAHSELSAPNPLALAVAAQALEIMDRDGSKDRQFIAYKVGLPLMRSMSETPASRRSQEWRNQVYKTIRDDQDLGHLMSWL